MTDIYDGAPGICIAQGQSTLSGGTLKSWVELQDQPVSEFCLPYIGG
jgi:hypothetical protein